MDGYDSTGTPAWWWWAWARSVHCSSVPPPRASCNAAGGGRVRPLGFGWVRIQSVRAQLNCDCEEPSASVRALLPRPCREWFEPNINTREAWHKPQLMGEASSRRLVEKVQRGGEMRGIVSSELPTRRRPREEGPGECGAVGTGFAGCGR